MTTNGNAHTEHGSIAHASESAAAATTKTEKSETEVNWEARFKGLQRVVDSYQATIDSVKSKNQGLVEKMDGLVNALGGVAGKEEEAADPFDVVSQKIATLEQRLVEQEQAAKDAAFNAERTKMLAEYDLVSAADMIREDRDLERQRKIIESFANFVGTKTAEAVSSKKKTTSAPPPKTSKPPTGNSSAGSLDDLKAMMNEAAEAGDTNSFNKIRDEYYAALTTAGIGLAPPR